MREETRKTARVQAGEEAVETVNEKTLMDQLDSMKTAFRGYDKEATCELLQTLIRSMETEKKEEHRVLLQKNQRLVNEKEALTTQMAELLMKVDSLLRRYRVYKGKMAGKTLRRGLVMDEDNHRIVWNTRRNHMGWACYLKGLEGQPIPAYASPARREDYSGLPPAYTFVSTKEPFYAETLAYVDGLRRAGVEAEADVYPGLFHAFDMLAPYLPASRRAAAAFERQFVLATARYFAPQP